MLSRIVRCAGLVVVATLALADTTPQPATQAAGREKQWWKGRITIPMMPLDVVVVFTPKGDAEWTATIDIPMQGADDLALTDVVLDARQLRFRIPPPADALFELDRDKDATASGSMRQHGMTFPVAMERITESEAAAVGPERPQTPKPPFPYATREVTYKNDKAGVTLAGTLSIPEGKGPHPAVLMITGSGPQDRDETLFGHKPFAVIADHLTRRGVAVLRVDDRGVGGSTTAESEATSEDFAGDVLAGVKFLREQSEIDGKRIALLGHSEGALIAPMVVAEHPDQVAAIVLLAPPGLPGRDILRSQLATVLIQGGLPREKVDEQLKLQREALDRAAAGADVDELRPLVRELVKAQSGAAAATMDDAQLGALTESAVEQIAGRWMRFFIRYDPRDALKRVRGPVLVLFGEKDFQVPPKQNLPEVESALKASENADVTIKTLPGLNHLFQEAATGQFAEYAQITQTISPTALDEIAAWLARRLDVR